MATWTKVVGNDEAAQSLQQMPDAGKSADQHLDALAHTTLTRGDHRPEPRVPQARRGGRPASDRHGFQAFRHRLG